MKLSPKVTALIASGASALAICSQFLTEKEGVKLDSYQDAGGVWTICYGDTKGVTKGMHRTAQQCEDSLDERIQEASDQLDKLAPDVDMTPAQRAGIISFCTYNIGVGKCKSSTFIKMLNDGDRSGACRQIQRWIWDNGNDCRIKSNNCRGQVDRREQEYLLCMTNG